MEQRGYLGDINCVYGKLVYVSLALNETPSALPRTPLFGQLHFLENFWSFEAASSSEVSCRTFAGPLTSC